MEFPKERMDQILTGRKLLRQYFLDNEYDYLFFADTDVIIPPNTLSKLLKHNKDLVTGIYVSNMVIKRSEEEIKRDVPATTIVPCVFGKAGSEEEVRLVGFHQVKDDKLIKIYAAGLGCCLIKRKIVEKINFRVFDSGQVELGQMPHQ